MLTSGTERRGTQSYWNQKDCVGERLVSQKENRGSVSRIDRSWVTKTKTKTNSCPTSPEHLQWDVHRQPAVNLTHLLPNSISPTVFLSIIKVMINNLLNLETWRQPITLLTSSLVSASETPLICPFLDNASASALVWDFNISCLDYFTRFLSCYSVSIISSWKPLYIAAEIIFLKYKSDPVSSLWIFYGFFLAVHHHGVLGGLSAYGPWWKSSVAMGKEPTLGQLDAPSPDLDSRALGTRMKREWIRCSVATVVAASPVSGVIQAVMPTTASSIQWGMWCRLPFQQPQPWGPPRPVLLCDLSCSSGSPCPCFLFFFLYKFIFLFIFGCVGSSLLCAGFL